MPLTVLPKTSSASLVAPMLAVAPLPSSSVTPPSHGGQIPQERPLQQAPYLGRRSPDPLKLKKNLSLLFVGFLLNMPLHASEAPAAASLQTLLEIAAVEPSSCIPLEALPSKAKKQLQRFYQLRHMQPLWGSVQQVRALAGQFATLADDGLEPRQYAQPLLSMVLDAERGAQPCEELQLTHAYLQALRHLAKGRLEQAEYEPLWRSEHYTLTAESEVPDLQAVAPLENPAQAFTLARPQLPQYQHLRQAYARLRQQTLADWPPLAAGSSLHPGQQDPRVPQLANILQHLGLYQGDPPKGQHYGPALVEALTRFQALRQLQTDGILGPATLAALNISPRDQLDRLRLNLERWRWLARDWEPNMLLVDITDSQVLHYEDGALVWQARTQVGRADRETPRLKSQVVRLTINPTWTVPPTIFKKDKLPRIRRDLGYLRRHNMIVLNYQGQQLNPAKVNWNGYPKVLLRQAAGPRNPLGRVVIRFANPYSVYLHDTPSKGLFARSSRAVSSGCVRVQNALQLADQLLTPAEQNRVKQLLQRGRTTEYRLEQSLPILISYWTASANEQGQVHYRRDIYNQDSALLTALEHHLALGHAQ